MAHALEATAAEQLDEPLDDERDERDDMTAERLAALRAVIARGRSASKDECISAEEALAELDAITLGP